MDATIITGPKHDWDSLTRHAAAWMRCGLIPPAGGPEAERRTIAAVAVLLSLHDKAGIRNRAHLRKIFDGLTTGDAPLIDQLLEDAREGTPVLVMTHWGTMDGRSATSFIFKLTANLEDPIVAPSDEWEALMDGVLSLAPLFDRILDSSVVPFKRTAH